LAELLGKIFQIRDDYKNLQSNDYAVKKGTYEDISEGKYSFPIIHSIHTNPGNPILRIILKQRTDNERVKEVAVSCLRATDSLTYTQRVIGDLILQARTAMHKLDDRRETFGGIAEILHLLQK
jgi:geranylgeranyl diphosphate synthase type 3